VIPFTAKLDSENIHQKKIDSINIKLKMWFVVTLSTVRGPVEDGQIF
jgi:hypothetical protein